MAQDRNKCPVRIGDHVMVLSLDPKVLASLPSEERVLVESMLGEVFEVYDTDEYGQAWVEKWWDHGDDEKESHSLGLSSNQMLIVEGDR